MTFELDRPLPPEDVYATRKKIEIVLERLAEYEKEVGLNVRWAKCLPNWASATWHFAARLKS